MPWPERSVLDGRKEFIAQLAAGWSMSELCRLYGISRKTGYKWKARAEAGEPLADQSRAPKRRPNETPWEVVEAVLELRMRHPLWGPKKLRALLQRQRPELVAPAASTIGNILKKHGMVAPRRVKRRTSPYRGTLTEAQRPNQVWGMDFKGQFHTGDGLVCWPLTVTDLASRYLLVCDALPGSRTSHVVPALLRAFRTHGLPEAIRTDNGSPFASRAPGGLSRLAVWWVKLGIRPERIVPGRPQQNGRHERMHKTLKRHTARPPRASKRAQQRAFDAFRAEFNELRPHEGLDLTPPAEHYEPSTRAFPSCIPAPEYNREHVVVRPRDQGIASFLGRDLYCGRSLAGELVGLRETSDGIWRVEFYDFVVGFVNRRDPGMLRPV